MNRRQFKGHLAAAAGFLLVGASAAPVAAQQVREIGPAETAAALKAALEKGVHYAVNQLGRADGFLGNEKVRIPLPGLLDDAARLLRKTGQRDRVDALVLSMNRAAEAAVPLARELLVSAVRGLTVQDAARIVTGGETSVTDFFAGRTRTALTAELLPVVSRATEKAELATRYNKVVEKVTSFGLLNKQESRLEDHVTAKTLDGIYYMIGEQEKVIRRDPLAAGSKVISTVFGALR